MHASDLFSLPDSLDLLNEYFKGDEAPWKWLSAIAQALKNTPTRNLPKHASIPPGVSIKGLVYITPSVTLPPYARLEGPAWIGPGTEIRPGAYIRGNVIIGANCVIGNACEYKNCLLMDDVETPHYNYVGDSILGNGAHLGAGVICSNLRLDRGHVQAHTPTGRIPTDRKKLGAIVGEAAEVGSNASLQPGTILGKRAVVMPGLAYGGYLEDEHIVSISHSFQTRKRRD